MPVSLGRVEAEQSKPGDGSVKMKYYLFFRYYSAKSLPSSYLLAESLHSTSFSGARMKTFVIVFSWMLCVAFILTPPIVVAQQDNIRCGTMEYLEKQKKADPSLEARMQQYEEQIQIAIASMKQSKALSLEKGKPVPPPPPPFTPVTIPVVVHIIHNPTLPAQNISAATVAEQIAITNRDYAGLNPNVMGSFLSTLKANTQIQFCLAQKTPSGQLTNGIEWRETTIEEFPTDNSMKYYSSGGLDAWDPTQYFNIWVCNIATYAGYAQFPTSGLSATYGVVVDYACFGYRDPVTIYRGGGACTTHEIGHCLNLRHIWGDDNTACTGTDYCDDTPNQAGSTISWTIISGEVTDACSPTSPGINYQNFMDYTRDIAQANFTPDQTLRMQACFAPGGPLVPLLSSTAGTVPSACEIPTALRTTALTRTTASLSWTAMYNNTGGYDVRYKKTSVSAWTNTTSTTNSILLTALTKNTNYEWQVQNICTGGGSGWSASRYFKTPNTGAAKTDGNEEASAPTVLAISPNPVMGLTTISYTLSEPGTSSITIVNALGAEVARLSAGQLQDAGTYSLHFDASRLIPGLYFVRFSSGRTIETAKFVIQR